MKKSIITLGIAILTSIASVQSSAANVSAVAIERDYNSPTPLCMAIVKGEFDIVKKFIEYGANVNEKSNGLTPLMMAARYNRVDIVNHLIESGAKLNEKSENGFTALKWAEASGAKEVVEILKSKGAK